MEVLGTIAFAVSGALIAVRCGLDLFGVLLVGCITAVGGGIMRDVFLGKTPPTAFSNIYFLVIAGVTALGIFIVSYFNAKKFEAFNKKIEHINNVFDAIGLAAFSVTGTEMACAAGFADSTIFCVAMGLITGVGGGMIRDVLVDKTPYVLRKHVYAVASILGSVLYYYIRIYASRTAALLVAMPVIFIVRMLATKYHWKLPRIQVES
jgi:uncharacterized membrane protein YeiH